MIQITRLFSQIASGELTPLSKTLGSFEMQKCGLGMVLEVSERRNKREDEIDRLRKTR